MSLEVITQPKISIDPEIFRELKNETEELGQVVLHFLYNAPLSMIMNIRIWPSTYLYDQHSSHRSDLVHVEHISIAPMWMPCLPGEKLYFTLVFSGLPKGCTIFDFVEECNTEAFAFEARGIIRNNSDVYYLEMT
jgi:hypothetical protein